MSLVRNRHRALVENKSQQGFSALTEPERQPPPCRNDGHLASLVHSGHQLPSHFWFQLTEGAITAAFDDLDVMPTEAAIWELDPYCYVLLRANPHRITARKFNPIEQGLVAHSDYSDALRVERQALGIAAPGGARRT